MSEYNTPLENSRARDLRLRAFRSIVQEEFQLVYFGHLDYKTIDDMAVTERNVLYQILIEQKKAEQKAQQEAINEAKKKRHNHARR